MAGIINNVMNLYIPLKVKNSFSDWATSSFLCHFISDCKPNRNIWLWRSL